ncbi:hypothetical protein 1 [Human tombus-like virus]
MYKKIPYVVFQYLDYIKRHIITANAIYVVFAFNFLRRSWRLPIRYVIFLVTISTAISQASFIPYFEYPMIAAPILATNPYLSVVGLLCLNSEWLYYNYYPHEVPEFDPHAPYNQFFPKPQSQLFEILLCVACLILTIFFVFLTPFVKHLVNVPVFDEKREGVAYKRVKTTRLVEECDVSRLPAQLLRDPYDSTNKHIEECVEAVKQLDWEDILHAESEPQVHIPVSMTDGHFNFDTDNHWLPLRIVRKDDDIYESNYRLSLGPFNILFDSYVNTELIVPRIDVIRTVLHLIRSNKALSKSALAKELADKEILPGTESLGVLIDYVQFIMPDFFVKCPLSPDQPNLTQNRSKKRFESPFFQCVTHLLRATLTSLLYTSSVLFILGLPSFALLKVTRYVFEYARLILMYNF